MEIGKPGFRFKSDFERPQPHLIEEFGALMQQTGCLTGNIGDCLSRTAAMDSRVKGLSYGMRLLGPALTVKVPPTDNLMIHKAITLIKPGDVLVVEGGGNHNHALLGALIVRALIKAGAAGIVVDGAVRDSAEIREIGFPLFAAGISPNGPFKEGPGEVNYPIQCGGQVVRPGDIVVGDDDGVVVIKIEAAKGCIDNLRKVIEFEAKIIASIENGQPLNPNLDEILGKKGLGK